MMAEYISDIFDDDVLASRFSNNAKTIAKERHNTEVLENTIISIYKKISDK